MPSYANKLGIGRVLAACVASASLVGCTTDSPEKPPKRNDICAVGSTLVCEERVGQVTKCSCKSKDSMRDILEPEPY